ncbi:hypothetical protein LTR37_001441 [Vermiconidia calcicola]|uniref:Uncharacterized protein n=1 Tax=Vermiconidia calcicola TaxID=1690605 RepID=A0ACC3NW59_9PEZI|nr:hypothetical protein LTR37_001441 [Vermiconidia calcicola]
MGQQSAQTKCVIECTKPQLSCTKAFFEKDCHNFYGIPELRQKCPVCSKRVDVKTGASDKAENWPVANKQCKGLHLFHRDCLRNIVSSVTDAGETYSSASKDSVACPACSSCEGPKASASEQAVKENDSRSWRFDSLALTLWKTPASVLPFNRESKRFARNL